MSDPNKAFEELLCPHCGYNYGKPASEDPDYPMDLNLKWQCDNCLEWFQATLLYTAAKVKP